MYCHECGNVVTEGAAFCPKCGTKIETEGVNPKTQNVSTQASDTNVSGATNTPNQTPTTKPKKPITKKWWFWGIIVIVVIVTIIVIASFGGGGEDTGTSADETSQMNNNDEVVKAGENEPMSAVDVYVWLAANDELGYSVPEKAVSFIESNPQFFPGSDKNTGAMSDHVDYEADYPHVAKSPGKYADKLMSVDGDIVDCEEIETDYGTVTYLQINDYSGYNYCMYYLGVLEDAFEGYPAWAKVLPFGTITFENVGGYYTKAVIGAACYVEVGTYDDYDY